MLTLRGDTSHVWYLDASALVKLVVDEEGHEAVRRLYNENPNCYATPFCLMEALGIIKGMWKKTNNQKILISDDQYFAATRRLIIDAWGGKICPDSIDLFTPNGLDAVEALAKKHDLDLSDALQLETLLNGQFKVLGGDSKPILVTADKGLAKAARCEGFRAWDCKRDPMPEEAPFRS